MVVAHCFDLDRKFCLEIFVSAHSIKPILCARQHFCSVGSGFNDSLEFFPPRVRGIRHTQGLLKFYPYGKKKLVRFCLFLKT